ncbi:MAG: PKD domain-containing protein, partial [Verrucomicrobia bacterium]|nr:PKD domain-containing protein [Verrucomicrobiota bacterium]
MRNPNRLVGTLMAVVVVVGLIWWVVSERRTVSDSVSSPSLSQPNSPVVTSQPPTPAAVPATPTQTSLPAKPQDPVYAFKDWASRYTAANDAAAKASLLGEGIGLAEQRRKVMEATIRANPAQAIRDALPFSVRQAMPETILGLLEKVVAGNGDLDVLGAVGAKGGPKPGEPIQRWVNLNGERYKAFVYGARRLDSTRRGEPLWGVALGGLIAVSEDPGRLLAEDEAAALLAGGKRLDDPICGVSGVASQPGMTPRVMELGSRLQGICSAAHASVLNSDFRKARQTKLLPSDPGGSTPTNGPAARTISVTQGRFNVLFMLVSFEDDPREPIGRDELSQMMNDVNDYYRTASYNLVQMHTTITPVLRLRRSVVYYTGIGAAGPIGLLEDARAAAAEAGYDIEDYDLDVLGHAFLGGTEFDYGGLGFVGARGSWIQSFTPKVIVHELGHNLGLSHANASDTTRPPYDPPATIPPTPINAASYFGHFGVPRHSRHADPISDLTFDVEYGDPNDWMGNGDSLEQQFNSLHKFRLKWLPHVNIAEASAGVSRHRIYAFDATDALPDRQYSLYVEKEPNRQPSSRGYWIDHRALTAGNPYLQNGVLLYWTPWEGTAGTAQLLDMTPGSQGGVDDSALALGRTFSDEQSGIDITPVARGGQGREIWYDIVVNRGRKMNNRAPNFVLGVSSDFVEVGQTVVCAAENVLDPDGDEVSVYWHFSDETQPSNEPAVSRSFSSPGHYVVRCEVSDMKGGKRSQHRVITVGAPSTVVLQGVVRDENGAPLSDAIVAVIGGNQLVTLSDSEGRYSLAGPNNSLVTNVAYKHGFETSPANFDNPAPVINGDGPSMDHVAVALPLVSVQATGATMDEGLGSLGSSFRFNRRGGEISNSLVVHYALVGNASDGSDYQWGGTPGTIVFEPGVTNVDVPVTVLDDRTSEGVEFVVAQLLLATNIERYINYVTNIVETNVIIDGGTSVTNIFTNNYLVVFTNSVPVPGWELRTINGVETWFQSYYPYAIGNELASMTIADNDPPVPSTISAVLFDETALENGQDDASVVLRRTNSLDQAIAVNISVSGTASNGLDYIVVESPVRFASGQSVAVVVIRAKDDLLIEGDEVVTVKVEPGDNYTASADPQTVIIVDNDLPMVTVTADVSEAQESQFGFPLLFTISRAG